jgi:phosphopantetheine--protein transferase-like protein
MNEEQLKEIIAPFVKLPVDRIELDTKIDRSAVQSSILLHRMYARLAEGGVNVTSYTSIRVFGDLVQQGRDQQPIALEKEHSQEALPLSVMRKGATQAPASGIGIDIEAVGAMPLVTDFRRDIFYTMNFTPAETAYCILQPDAYASFAGIFAAKEAIVKADNQYRSSSFNALEIEHSPEGIPLFEDFKLSISHAAGLAVAVAVRQAAPVVAGVASTDAALLLTSAKTRRGSSSWLGWITLLIAVAALVLALK